MSGTGTGPNARPGRARYGGELPATSAPVRWGGLWDTMERLPPGPGAPTREQCVAPCRASVLGRNTTRVRPKELAVHPRGVLAGKDQLWTNSNG